MSSSTRGSTVDLLHGPVVPSLIRFSIPIILSNIFQQLYNTADTVLVGHLLGETSLAAIGASTPIYDLLVGFAIGVGNGLALVTARCLGKGDEDQLKRSVAGSLLLALGICLMVTLGSLLGATSLLRVLNTPENVLPEASGYIVIILGACTVTVAYNLLSALMRAVGNSVAPMVFLLISSVLNIGLDALLLSVTDLGVKGAAIATVISQGISVVGSILYILRRCRILLPARRHFVPDRELYADMLGQGLSMGLMGSLVSAGSLALQSGINSMGYLVIAGHATARKLFSFSTIPFFAVGIGMSTFASQNRGANQCDRIRHAVKQVGLLDVGIAALFFVFMLLFSRSLAEAVSGSHEEVLISNCSRYLIFCSPFFAVLGSLVNFRYCLQGLGAKRLPLISSAIEMIGKIVFVSLLVPKYGYDAIICCEPCLWIIMTLQLAWSFYTHPLIQACRPMKKPVV